MISGNNIGEKVLQMVIDWTPEADYDHERKFQNDLQSYLDWRLNEQQSSGGMFESSLGSSQNTGDIPVYKEHGRSKGDVVVDDIVGIELKRDLSNSQTKQLVGQIQSYKKEYEYVIVCACGIDDLSGWRQVKRDYETDSGGISIGQQPTPVWFVEKKPENYGTKKEQQSNGTEFSGFSSGLDSDYL